MCQFRLSNLIPLKSLLNSRLQLCERPKLFKPPIGEQEIGTASTRIPIMIGDLARRLLLAPPAKKLFQNDQRRSDGDKRVGEIEDRKRPCRQVEKDIIDHIAVHHPVNQIADSATYDKRKTIASEDAIGWIWSTRGKAQKE